MADKGTEERSLPPSKKKLTEARKKGQVAKSKDMLGAIAFALVSLYLVLQGHTFIIGFESMLTKAADSSGEFTSSSVALSQFCLTTAARLVVPMFAIAVAGVMGAAIVTLGGLPISFEPVSPKFEAINPIEGFKKLFSLRSVVEFCKTLFKILIMSGVVIVAMLHFSRGLALIPDHGLADIAGQFSAMMLPILIATSVLFVGIGLADVGLQTWLFRRDQRMGRSEQKRETKDAEGDPQLKRHRKQLSNESAMATGRVGIDHASFIVLGRGTVLVAIRYVRGETPVPVMVARARGHDIDKLLRQAEYRQLQIIDDPVVAGKIGNATMPGGYIPESTYQSVAMMLARMGHL
jgi:type III secretion protein U